MEHEVDIYDAYSNEYLIKGLPLALVPEREDIIKLYKDGGGESSWEVIGFTYVILDKGNEYGSLKSIRINVQPA